MTLLSSVALLQAGASGSFFWALLKAWWMWWHCARLWPSWSWTSLARKWRRSSIGKLCAGVGTGAGLAQAQW